MITTVSANTNFIGNKPQTTARFQPSFGDRGSLTLAEANKIYREAKSREFNDNNLKFWSKLQLYHYLAALRRTLLRLVKGTPDK